MNSKIAVISSPLVEGLVDIQNDERSDISSIIDTEVKKEADNIHKTFKATSYNSLVYFKFEVALIFTIGIIISLYFPIPNVSKILH